MQNKFALIIFTKYPQPGKVKTRLAETIGNETALKIYNIISESIFEKVHKCQSFCDVFLFYEHTADLKNIKEWVGFEFDYRRQIGADLGEKMSNAFNKVFQEGYERAIIIGTDVPDHSVTALQNSFNILDSLDVVIGPSQDGGYYLLGMNKYYPFLFENIKWSTAEVTAKTIEKINSNNFSYKLLNHLHDIDTEKDLHKWLEEPNNTISIKKRVNEVLKQKRP